MCYKKYPTPLRGYLPNTAHTMRSVCFQRKLNTVIEDDVYLQLPAFVRKHNGSTMIHMEAKQQYINCKIIEVKHVQTAKANSDLENINDYALTKMRVNAIGKEQVFCLRSGNC